MDKVLLVGFGGFVGSAGRYLVGGGVHRLFPRADFPYGTLAVNIIGCTVIGVLGALADMRNVLGADTRAFLLLGVLGGFTTFSTFAYETLALARDGDSLRAASNVILHMGGCLVAVWIGDTIGRALGSLGA